MDWKEQLPKLLEGHYACTRVWEAWQVGTMTQDDFHPLEEDEEVIADFQDFISTEIIEKLIADIPDELKSIQYPDDDDESLDLKPLKQQLRNKWL